MLGDFRFRRVLSRFSDSKEDVSRILSGTLGLTSDTIQVPNRDGFVYVRLRDNLNEVIEAYNGEVSLVYNLPILLKWDKTRYIIIGRDLERYAGWETSSAYLPIHGSSHSFSESGGGDVVWVFSRQIIPWLITPSGSSASGNAIVQEFPYYYNGQWKFLGTTGTPDLSTNLPTGGNMARMSLVYLNPDDNILEVSHSTTEFSNLITGTAEVVSFLPTLTQSQYIPLAGVRLITGTYKIGWSNLYDVRPFFGGAGGASVTGFTDGSVLFSENESIQEDNDNFFYDNTNNSLLLGNNTSTLVDSSVFLRALKNSAVGQIIASVGTVALSYLGLYRARGTADSPEAVQNGDVLGRIYFNGHDGTGWQSKARWDAKATENWSATNRGSEIEARTTKIAGTDTEKVGSWKGHGLELVKAFQTGQSVMVSGSYATDPEDCIILASWNGASGTSMNITLHSPTYESQILYIKRVDVSNYNYISVRIPEGETIDGQEEQTLINQYESLILIANGTTSWDIFSSSVELYLPNTIDDSTINEVTVDGHTHQLGPIDIMDASQLQGGGDADEIGLQVDGVIGQTNPITRIRSLSIGANYSGWTKRAGLYLATFDTQSLIASNSVDTVYPSRISVQGAGSAVTLTSDPQIDPGSIDGQLLLLRGADSTNTLTFTNEAGIRIRSRTLTLYKDDWVLFSWNDDDYLWEEVSRNNKIDEQTWTFRTLISGTVYLAGFYKLAETSNDFSPLITFGTTNTATGAKFFVVLGQPTSNELTIRVNGRIRQSTGATVTNQNEDIVIPAGAVVNTYYETEAYWTGQLNISVIGGTPRECNYGLVNAWNKDDDEFRLVGVKASWLGGATDPEPNILVRHHKNTGWTFVSGSSATFPTELASLATDYVDDKDLESGEQGAWFRDNFSTYVSGSSQGVIVQVNASVADAFSFGNVTLRYRPHWY